MSDMTKQMEQTRMERSMVGSSKSYKSQSFNNENTKKPSKMSIEELNETIQSIKSSLKKNITLNIKSNDYVDNKNNDDYLFELNPINISGITLKDFNFPKDIDKSISFNDEKTLILVTDKQITIKINGGEYTIAKILNFLNNKLQNNNFNVLLENVNNKIKISNTKNFKIINNDSSILRFLGFHKESYSGLSHYESEDPFIHKISLLILNGEDENELCNFEIDSNKKMELFKTFSPIKIDSVIIRFKGVSDFFFKYPNNLTLIFISS
jgi:hypothetical protein